MKVSVNFLCIDGVELANSLRTLTYLRRKLAGPAFDVSTCAFSGDMLDPTDPAVCDTRDLLCYCPEIDTGPYVNPGIDDAPWYSQGRPESADFLGLLPETIEVRPTLSRGVTHGLLGASLGPQRAGGQLVEVRGFLYASSARGMSFGERWLHDVLAGSLCGSDPSLALLPYCPAGAASDVDVPYTPDSSSHARQGVLVGDIPPVLEPSPWAGFGNCLRFDGVDRGQQVRNQGVDVGVIPITTPFCLEARVEKVPGTVGRMIVAKYGSGSPTTTRNYELGLQNGTGRLFVIAYDDMGNPRTCLAGAIMPDGLHHVAGDWDGTTLRLFMDGASVGTPQVMGGMQTPDSVGHTFIGKDDSGNSFHGFPYQGRIDEVRISGASRYTASFTPPSAPFTSDANTLGLWHFDEIVVPPPSPWRNLPHIGLVSGPDVSSVQGVPDCNLRAVAFQLASESPWLLSDPFVLANRDLTGGGAVEMVASTDQWVGDAAFRLTLLASSTADLDVTISCGPSPNGTCPSPAPGSCFAYRCRRIPAGHRLVIDGVERDARIENPATGEIVAGLDSLEYDALMRWPEIAPCSNVCLTVTPHSGVTNARLKVEIVHREL